MGWMEILALLKRIAPLLGRLAPTLEAFLASRNSRTETDAALERVASDLRGHLSASGENLAELLAAQSAQIKATAEHVSSLRAADERTAAQLLALETSFSTLTRLLRWAAAVLFLLLLACLVLLIVLLRRPV